MSWRCEEKTQTTSAGSCSNKQATEYECVDAEHKDQYEYSTDAIYHCRGDSEKSCNSVVGVTWDGYGSWKGYENWRWRHGLRGASAIFRDGILSELSSAPRRSEIDPNWRGYSREDEYLEGFRTCEQNNLGFSNPICYFRDSSSLFLETSATLTPLCDWRAKSPVACSELPENVCRTNASCTRTPPKTTIQKTYTCINEKGEAVAESLCADIQKPTSCGSVIVPRKEVGMRSCENDDVFEGVREAKCLLGEGKCPEATRPTCEDRWECKSKNSKKTNNNSKIQCVKAVGTDEDGRTITRSRTVFSEDECRKTGGSRSVDATAAEPTLFCEFISTKEECRQNNNCDLIERDPGVCYENYVKWNGGKQNCNGLKRDQCKATAGCSWGYGGPSASSSIDTNMLPWIKNLSNNSNIYTSSNGDFATPESYP